MQRLQKYPLIPQLNFKELSIPLRFWTSFRSNLLNGLLIIKHSLKWVILIQHITKWWVRLFLKQLIMKVLRSLGITNLIEMLVQPERCRWYRWFWGTDTLLLVRLQYERFVWLLNVPHYLLMFQFWGELDLNLRYGSPHESRAKVISKPLTVGWINRPWGCISPFLGQLMRYLLALDIALIGEDDVHQTHGPRVARRYQDRSTHSCHLTRRRLHTNLTIGAPHHDPPILHQT